MHLTLRQLQCFSAVAKNLSYTKAAQELHLTQPAVSKRISNLEESLDAKLFDRRKTRHWVHTPKRFQSPRVLFGAAE